MTTDQRKAEYLAQVDRRIAERESQPDHGRDYLRAERKRIAEKSRPRTIGDVLPGMR